MNADWQSGAWSVMVTRFDGKVTHVDDKHNITAAYMFAGLRLPLGDSADGAKGDKLVGALGPE